MNARTLFAAAQAQGREGVLEVLPVGVEDLRAVTAALGIDPLRRARRWKDPNRIRDFIADEITKRATRFRSFFSEI